MVARRAGAVLNQRPRVWFVDACGATV